MSESFASKTRTAAQSVPLSLNISLDPASVRTLLDAIRTTVESAMATAFSNIQPSTPGIPPSPIVEASPQTKPVSVDLDKADRLKAADVRVALLMGKIPEEAGLLVDVRTLAKLMNISDRTLWRLQDEGAMPKALHLGSLRKWRLAEIVEWIDAGCPPMRAWTYKRQESTPRREK